MELLPDPMRVVEGLRDTGYDINTAVADIIDNSISAEASIIDIMIQMDYDGEVFIYFTDNGKGMNEDDLLNAMRYGSQVRPDPSSLGKFGLGMKTASTAFCRCLSVVTRDNSSGPIYKARWDLDHICNVGKWELLFPDITDQEKNQLDTIAPEGHGTLVLWEKVDRLIKTYSDRNGGYARRALEKVITNLIQHISMIYQRFLDPGDVRERTVEIRVNGQKVDAWDTFCLKETNTELVGNEEVEVENGDGEVSKFLIKAYVLPRKDQFSTEEAAKKARLTNDMQGIYIYRENRLIHHSDWLGMYQKEPHGTLLRVEFSFDHQLDDAFQVDIKKSKIKLNDELFYWIKDNFLPAPRRAADDRYRMLNNARVSRAATGAHDSSNAGIASKESSARLADIEVMDAETNEVNVQNRKGNIKIKLPIAESLRPGEVCVQPVDSIINGLLWEPCLIDMHHAVRINTSHPYYHKVYVPNTASGVTIQGMDSLLWAISEAELGTISEDTRSYFEDLKYEVSRLLRKLVEDLPEPVINDDRP
jgi:hypothetical protein